MTEKEQIKMKFGPNMYSTEIYVHSCPKSRRTYNFMYKIATAATNTLTLRDTTEEPSKP